MSVIVMISVVITTPYIQVMMIPLGPTLAVTGCVMPKRLVITAELIAVRAVGTGHATMARLVLLVKQTVASVTRGRDVVMESVVA